MPAADRPGMHTKSLGQPSIQSNSATTLVDHIQDDKDIRKEPSQKSFESRVEVLSSGRNESNDSLPLSLLRPGRNKPRFLLDILFWWIPELVSSALSVACILCIAIILRIYDGHVATDLYLSSSLTLNGLVAAIATINRACLTAPVCSAIMQEMWLYFASESKKDDCASRLQDLDMFHKASTGSWGSLRFLIRSRGSRLVASFGCSIIILSIVYSTFTQQLVSLSLLPISTSISTSPGNIPRSETWSVWGGTEFDALSSFDPGLDMIGALYSGVLADDVPPIEAKCSTGNCTWPESPSMAICGGCAKSTFEKLDCNDDSTCDYSLPSGSVATLYDFDNQSDKAGAGFQVIPGRGAIFNSSLNDRLYVMNVDLFGAPYWSFAESNPHLSNTECALWICIQSYKINVTSTIQHQELLQQYDEIDTSYHNLNVSGLAFNGGTFYDFPKLPPRFGADAESRFSVDLWAYLALQQYLHGAMQGSVRWHASQHFSNDLIRGIWKGTTDPHTWINNIATSMTNVVRSTNSSSRAQYNGVASSLTIKIRWEWLALPAALVLLSILFLFIVMFRTACSPVHSWKGSPLTLLLFDIDRDIKEQANGKVDRHNGVKRAIGKTKVRLIGDGGVVRRFQAVDLPP